jgi:O-antigen/teichoic acid export membrane protein
MTVEQQAVRSLKWTAAGRAVGQVVSWAATLWVLRLLAPEDYGLMAIVATWSGIGLALADFGLGAALVRSRDDPGVQRALAGVVWVWHAALALLFLALAPALAWFHDDARLQPLLMAASTQFLLAGAGAVPMALRTRAMDFRHLAITEALGMVAASATTLGLALQGAGVWALVAGTLAGAGARAALLVAGGPWLWPSWRWGGLGPSLRYSAGMASGQLLWTFVSQSDVLVASRLLPRDALGVYAVALHLATMPMNKLMGVVNQVAFAAVAALQDEAQRLRARLLTAVRLMLVIAGGVMWGAAALAPEWLPWLLGERWAGAVLPLQLVSVMVPLRMVAMLLATALGGVGASGAMLRNTLTTALVWPVCFAVGCQWGVQGLAAAWLVASPLSLALNLPRITRTLGLGLGELLRELRLPVLAAAVMATVIALLRPTLPLAGPAAIAPLALAGALAYLAVLALDRRWWHDLRQVLAAR